MVFIPLWKFGEFLGFACAFYFLAVSVLLEPVEVLQLAERNEKQIMFMVLKGCGLYYA
jgi:hypothetical protein